MATYYKLLNPDLKHYNFTYKEGLNELSEPFNPDPLCKSGGLYFSDQDNIFKWIELYDYNPDLLIACVTLPEDAQFITIYTYKKKYKSDKIILSNIQRLDNLLLNPNIALKAVKQNDWALQYVKEQTENICMEAIKQSGYTLQYVKNQTEEICMEAVKQNGRALRFVKEQTEAICIEAVKQNYLALEYVKDKTDDICMEAAKQYDMILEFVKQIQ